MEKERDIQKKGKRDIPRRLKEGRHFKKGGERHSREKEIKRHDKEIERTYLDINIGTGSSVL